MLWHQEWNGIQYSDYLCWQVICYIHSGDEFGFEVTEAFSAYLTLLNRLQLSSKYDYF